MTGLPSDVRLCYVAFDPDQHERRAALLSEEERARMAAFKSPKRRRDFVLGRTSARLLLADALGVPPGAVPLRVADSGAVDVEGAPYRLSIAHADAHAVAAVAERPIGVDLERVRPRRPDLYRFLLHPDEGGLLDRLAPDRTAAIVLCWTLKEATLKAMRTGLRCSPKDVRLDVRPGGTSIAADVRGCRWRLWSERRGGHYLAVAYAETELERTSGSDSLPRT